MTDQLLGELKPLNSFLIRNIDALHPNDKAIELVITCKQLMLLQIAVGGWIDDIKEENNTK